MRRKRYRKWKMAATLTAVLLAAGGMLGGMEKQSWKSDTWKVDKLIGEENENQSEDLQSEQETPVSGKLEVHFIDVGQGDATLVICDGQAMLIDAGNNDKGTTVQGYLQNQGVTSLNYVVGTHPDADHIGGLDVILYKFDCNMVLMPDVENDTKTYQEAMNAMGEKGYVRTEPVPGTTYALGAATFTIVAPNRDYGEDLNNWSVGLLLEYGENRFLFTGDAEAEAEADIINNGIDIAADVYKVAHHGSADASSVAFLQKVQPEYAVISVGEENSYGHPHAEVLNHLRQMGVKLFRTDEQGTIVVVSDGKTLTWNTGATESWQTGR